MAYHEIEGSRRYEYRYIDGDYFTSWADAGDPTIETLAAIRAGLPGAEYEVREVCTISNEAGDFWGKLVFAKLVEAASLNELV